MTTVIPITTKRSTKTTHQTTPHFCAHILNLYDLSLDGKLYVFPIESAFEYSHNSKPENHGSVTFSENRKSMMSYTRDFPVECVIKLLLLSGHTIIF